MREFFGFGGYTRPAEGFLSWQHLVFVTSLVLVMIGLAILLGKRNRNKSLQEKNKVLIWAAILIDGFELFKIVLLCFRSEDPMNWLYNLPLFLCSIQLIAIPMAAFTSGRGGSIMPTKPRRVKPDSKFSSLRREGRVSISL